MAWVRVRPGKGDAILGMNSCGDQLCANWICIHLFKDTSLTDCSTILIKTHIHLVAVRCSAELLHACSQACWLFILEHDSLIFSSPCSCTRYVNCKTFLSPLASSQLQASCNGSRHRRLQMHQVLGIQLVMDFMVVLWWSRPRASVDACPDDPTDYKWLLFSL